MLIKTPISESQANRVITALQREVGKQKALNRIIAALQREVTRQKEEQQ